MKQDYKSINLDWQKINAVLLDMDGTLLDLHFDNYFWQDFLPELLAEKNNESIEQAKTHLFSLQDEVKGTLDWYCLDYWSTKLQVDIKSLKREILHKISFRPNALEFLEYLKDLQGEKEQKKTTPLKIIMATNAHPDAIEIKMMKAEMSHYFDSICSSHEIGYAKEDQRFWALLMDKYQLLSSNCLFIDDSLSVLKSAEQFGIGYLLAIDKPDSQRQKINAAPFTAISNFEQLIYK